MISNNIIGQLATVLVGQAVRFHFSRRFVQQHAGARRFPFSFLHRLFKLS